MEADGTNVEAIAAEVLAYLAAHPDATDGIRGVQRWWLAPSRVEPSLEVVQRALNRLVACGNVASRKLSDGTILYSARRGGKKG